jgi:hypothetical protein
MLGLFAIHLILDLDGQVALYSDCLGALGNVANVPDTRLPARTKHADILKIIMVHCQAFPFDIIYRHIRAHQDKAKRYCDLIWQAQLNCQVDYIAKNVLWGLEVRRASSSSTGDASAGSSGCVCREGKDYFWARGDVALLGCKVGCSKCIHEV